MQIKMSQARFEALTALAAEGRYLLRRASANMSKMDRLTCLLRSNVIELVGHREKRILEVSGQVAAWMEKDGMVEKIDMERPAKGALYVITPHGRAVFERCRAALKSGQRAPWHKDVRVTEKMVSEFAARFGCIITFNVARQWYELESLNEDEKLIMPTVCHPKTNRRARKLGDMTPEEWAAAIGVAAERKRPAEDDTRAREAD